MKEQTAATTMERSTQQVVSLTSRAKKTGLELLREPLPKHLISWKCMPTSKDNRKGTCPKCKKYHGLPATSLEYAGHAAITDRLLDADPEWNYKIVSGKDVNGFPATDKDGGMWIELTVCGVTRMGYGDANGKTGPNAMKERIGDALRNAAMRFGLGLELWHQGDLHVDDPTDDATEEPTEKEDDEPESRSFEMPVPAAEGPKENLMDGIEVLRKGETAADTILRKMWNAKSADALNALFANCNRMAPEDKKRIHHFYTEKKRELARLANEPAPPTARPQAAAYDMDEPPPIVDYAEQYQPATDHKARVQQLATRKRK